jgi:hypothetical protein
MNKLTLKTEGNTHVVVTRRFAAPPEAAPRSYRSETNPEMAARS